METAFRAKGPYNAVRLILPKREGSSLKPYEEIHGLLSDWIKERILLPDPKPAIYVYRIRYHDRGMERTNLGFFALVKLEEYSKQGVMPHEDILPGPREDRLKLRLATQADFGPVYLVYSDAERIFEKVTEPLLTSAPLAVARDIAGEMHELWALTDGDVIRQIIDLLATRPVLIADGHHRYDAALESSRRNPDDPWFAYRLAGFFNSEGGGLCTRPIHRILYDLKLSKGACLGRLAENFEVSVLYSGGSEEDFRDAQKRVKGNSENEHRFGLLLEDSFCLLACPRTENPDVVILNQEIFKNVLGFLDEELLEVLDYTKDAGEVARKVGEGEAKAGFILNPIRMEEIWRVAQFGRKLPPKSSSFYPKLLTGLAMNVNAEYYKKSGA